MNGKDAQIRQAFLSAVTGIPYEEIEETTLLPPVLRNGIRKTSLEFWMFGSN